MKQTRKDELIGCFPITPPEIIADMKEGDIFGRSRAANFCVFLTNGHELFVRCYHKYSRSNEIRESQRYVFAKDGFCRYGLNDEGKWKAMSFREPVFYTGAYYTDNSYIILNAEAINNSDMRYSRVFEWSNSSVGVISFLRLYCKHPNIEYLIESGYGELISVSFDYYYHSNPVDVYGGIDLKSNDLRKMLRLTRTEFKLLQGHEDMFNLYIKYRICREQLPGLKSEELLEIADSPFYAYELINCSKAAGTTIMRMFRYLTENNISAVIYRDYIDQCRKLGYDMHDTAIGLPHDLLAVHERYSEIIKYRQSEQDKQEFAKWFDVRKIFEYETDELILRQPKCPDEIIEEGKALHHCVGSYASRHSQGKTNIFFIRKKSDPITPYYTIEVSNTYHIVQCYGYKNNKNCEKPDEIKAFEQEYQQYLEELKHEQQRNKRKSA